MKFMFNKGGEGRGAKEYLNPPRGTKPTVFPFLRHYVKRKGKEKKLFNRKSHLYPLAIILPGLSCLLSHS